VSPTDCLHVPLTIQRHVLAVTAQRIEFRLRALTHTVLSFKMMTPRIWDTMHSDPASCKKYFERRMLPPTPQLAGATVGVPLPLRDGIDGASPGEKVYRVAGGADDIEVAARI
jgi:hypothetical protein